MIFQFQNLQIQIFTQICVITKISIKKRMLLNDGELCERSGHLNYVIFPGIDTLLCSVSPKFMAQ
jgi:hypothetical protein